MTMETVENDANVKIQVPWEDNVLCNEIVANDFDDVKFKSEPVDNSVNEESDALLTGNLFKKKEKNPNSINCLHKIIDIKDEFGHAMKDFDEVAESEKWNYGSMHAHFISRIKKICKLSSAESLIVANAMIKACKVELVSKELNHFEVIADLFRQIGGRSSRFLLFCSF